jgi:hypothetical protein
MHIHIEVPTLASRLARVIVLATALLVTPALTTAQTPSAARPAQTAPAASAPSIYFRAPRDGAVVGPTFDLAFGLKNYGVAPAGVKLANTGHFHVLIDVEPGAAGALVPADSLHRHYGGGQIETTLTLAPGRHTLRLVLADHEHKVIGPQLISAPARIMVRKR